jgi:hypothetical protein
MTQVTAIDTTPAVTFPSRELDAPARRPIVSLTDAVRRVARAIAAPPAHPLWGTPDATTQASLLPAREHQRLLSQGRLAPRS